MDKPLGGAFGPPSNGHHLGPFETAPRPMRKFSENDRVDVCIVGVGSGGGVLLQRLARAGLSVVGLDAGPFWDTERDWVSDEAGSHNLYWNDLRITGGDNPVALGSNNSGKGVGGGSVHWAAFAPRFHPSDFHIHELDGIGVDWPIRYDAIKPYYEMLEREMPVAGPARFPWGYPHSYPYGPHPTGEVGNVLVRGCTNLGIPVYTGGPVAITSGSYGDRPHCIYRGFCIQGCKVGAKASTLYTHVPDAIVNGAEVRANSMVGRINPGRNGLVDSVTYYDAEGREHQQKAKVIVISGYAIETPRLLLNSACPGHENGMANSSDCVGRYLMVQAGNVVLGRYPGLVRMYKAPPAHALTEEFYETDSRRDFARGFAVQTVGPLPMAFAKMMMVAKGAWGWGMRRVMMDYNHWAGIGLLGELLPWPDNRVELADEKDQLGLPVAKVTYSLKENDTKLIEFGKNKVEEILWAAGAEEVVNEARYAHLIGGARMGDDPTTSVVDKFGCTHDVANLFCVDGSIFPTQGSANPGLSIQSMAARIGGYMLENWTDISAGRRGCGEEPRIRKDLAVPGAYERGIPRIPWGGRRQRSK